MRLPLKGSDYFVKKINEAVETINEEFVYFLKPKLQMKKVDVMLGDGTITNAETFDPKEITNEFRLILENLNDWIVTDISNSKTEDLYRLYFQITCNIDKFYIYGYFGIQFHVLHYYKLDKEVIKIQKELIKLNQDVSESFISLADKGNKIIEEELRRQGFNNLPFEELFAKMYENSNLMNTLEQKAVKLEKQFPQIQDSENKREQLISQLNDMIIELYRITPVKIDYNGLMQGEEGIVSYFEIETIMNKKTGKRDPYIDTKKASSKEITETLTNKLDEIISLLKELK
ncbi:MAG TPA: hypothetical protein VFT83_02810 [Nitrososphaeraceae archaeon]|jgi:hypothetical protein|nr:hypothetical protein [Nitrososphaeraceae archaeon]HEU5172435.1 hypothetical protein [Nitrososphaeraceae archaeon]